MDGRAGRRMRVWIALALAIVIVPVTLSGAMLAWPDAIGRLVGAPRFATSSAWMLPVDRYAQAARTALAPGERIAAMILPDRRGAPVTMVVASGSGDTASGYVYLDPPTARVLEVAARDAGASGFLRRLHGEWLGAGRGLVGLCGVAVVMLVGAGMASWWPGGRRRRAGMRWPIYAGALVIAVPLLVLSVSGVWLAFAKPMPVSARPMVRPAQPLSVVVARAAAIAPGAVQRIVWPTERNPDWTVAVGSVAVKVADDSGSAVAAPARVATGSLGWSMRGVHDGRGGGAWWRVIGGLAPVLILAGGVVRRRLTR